MAGEPEILLKNYRHPDRKKDGAVRPIPFSVSECRLFTLKNSVKLL